jgi:hypothetical protein
VRPLSPSGVLILSTWKNWNLAPSLLIFSLFRVIFYSCYDIWRSSLALTAPPPPCNMKMRGKVDLVTALHWSWCDSCHGPNCMHGM